MHTNLYTDFRDEHSFASVKELVETLPEHLSKERPDMYNRHVNDDIESILNSVGWSALDREGERTMRETTYVRYKFERPGVLVRVNGVYETDGPLQETSVKVILGEYPDSAVFDFTVSPSGEVTL